MKEGSQTSLAVESQEEAEEVAGNVLQKREREDRPSRFVPRDFETSQSPEMDRMDYRNQRMEEILGIPFINSRRNSEEDSSVMEELGVDQVGA